MPTQMRPLVDVLEAFSHAAGVAALNGVALDSISTWRQRKACGSISAEVAGAKCHGQNWSGHCDMSGSLGKASSVRVTSPPDPLPR